jgi:hypothetical protein
MAISESALRLQSFLKENLDYLVRSGGSSEHINQPNFDLHARDYIGFAEKEIASSDERALINTWLT